MVVTRAYLMLNHHHNDRGASAILVAASLFLLMGFAAIAIDYSAAVNERRLDQSTADVSALSAGVELIVSGSVQDAVDSAKTLADTNLNRTVTNAEWAACTDPDALEHPSDTIPGVTNGSPCISFGANSAGVAFAKIRVRIPDQTTDTSFARIMGFTGLTSNAAAEVSLDGTLNSGAFPAGVVSGAGAGDTFCIKTSGGNSGSCGSPTTGDFGNFQPYFYTEINPGNPTSQCASGNQPAPLSRVIADGLDHFLGVTPTAPGNRVNGANCPQFPGPAFPNRVDSGSGYSNNDVTDGLIVGGSYDGAFTGRFTRRIWGSPYGTANIFTRQIDNRPLWSYINTSLSGLPSACTAAAAGPAQNDGSQEAEFLAAQADLISCLSDPAVPNSLFVQALYESPRLTIVPKYHESSPLGNNACCYNIKDFVPVFLDGIWTDRGPQWTCDQGMIDDDVNGFCKHEPGRVGTIHINAAGQRKVDSASAIVLSCDILPGVEPGSEKCRRIESGGGSTADIFINIFLTK